MEWLLYAGTEDGVRVIRLDGNLSPELVGQGIAGHAVRAIAINPVNRAEAYIGCGLRGWGLYLTRNAGERFHPVGFADRWVWDVAYQPDAPETIWVGTEPPMLYVSHDSGQSFQPLESIAELPGRSRWRFFHPPFFAGHIHGLAISPGQPERLIAGVEHGALIWSPDRGRTWYEALPGHDLHRIAIDPRNPCHMLAGAGEGLFVSHDGGENWKAVQAMVGKYIHAVVFDPHVRDRIYTYADLPGAPLYRSDDSGQTWQAIGRGLPNAQPADTLCVHPALPDVLLYAGDTARRESRLFLSTNAGASWTPLDLVLPKVWRLRGA